MSARPLPSSAAISDFMSKVRRKDSAPEVQLRSALHRLGLRFRVHTPVPGLPRRQVDVMFSQARVAVFVDGCFWHGCPEHGVAPKANATFWREKIRSNKARDRETDRTLALAGFRVIRVWEHEDPGAAAAKIELLVRRRKTPDAPTD